MNARLVTTTILAAIGFAQSALAQDAGNWMVRAGFHSIEPKSHGNALLDVEDAIGLTFDVTYTVAPQWSVELLTALPFIHEITLQGAGAVAETGLLPLTLSAQYRFNPQGHVRPYVGAGLNYTIFSDERTEGALQGTRLEFAASFGPAAQIGIDLDVIPGWYVNVDARWFDIDSDATLQGVSFGTVEIDPYAFGVSLGHRF